MANNSFDEVIKLALEIDGTDGVNALVVALKAVGDAGTAASPKAQELADQLENLAKQNDLITQFVSDKAALAALGDEMNATGAKLNTLKSQLAATATPSVALQKSVSATEASLVSLSSQFNVQQAALTKTSTALQAAGINTANLDSAQRDVQASIAGVAAEAQNLGKNLGTVAVATESAGEKAAVAGGLFETLRTHLVEIVSIAAGVELALKGIEFGSDSLKGAEQVEASLSRVKALAGDAAQSFGNLDAAIEQAARAVNVTTQQSAAGLTALVSQGLSANQAIAALVPTLQVAKIANEDVATAAGQVAEALKAYNVPAAQAAEIVDKLTAASTGAAGGLGQISAAASKLAPDAQAIGLSFDQVVSALGLLASKGQDSAKTTEGLRAVFQQLEDPVSNLRVALLALGDGTSDFDKAVAALTAKTPEAQRALLLLDGNARTLVQTLGNAGPGAIEAFNQGLQSTQGFAAKTASELDNNLTGASTRFINAIDRIGEALVAPILKPFTDELTKLAGELDAFAESDDFNSIKKSVADMATSAAKALDDFLNGINWKTFAQDAKTNIASIAKDLDSLAASATTAASAINKAGEVIGGAYHGVASVVDLAESAGAKILSLGLDVVKAGADITVGSEAASKGIDGIAKSVNDYASSKFDAATEHSRTLADDFTGVAESAPAAATGIEQTGTAAESAAPAMQQHADASTEAATASTQLGISLVGVPGYLQDIADQAGETIPKLSEIGQAASTIPDNVDEARAALKNAVDAFKELQASGNATPEALKAAGDAVSGLR